MYGFGDPRRPIFPRGLGNTWTGPFSPHTLLAKHKERLVGENDPVWNPHFGLDQSHVELSSGPETERPLCFPFSEVKEALGDHDEWHGLPHHEASEEVQGNVAESVAEDELVRGECLK